VRRDRLVDVARPVLDVLAVAGVQAEVEHLVFGGEFVKGGLDVAFEVLGNGHDEEWVVGEDAGAALDGLECEAAVALVGGFADLVVLVGC
jgi:hypothetical protein